MEGGVKPDPSRLEKVLQVIDEQNADIVGLQETLLTKGKENELITALREKGIYLQDIVFDREQDWAHTTGVALFSKYAASSTRIVGEKVKAVEMTFPVNFNNGDAPAHPALNSNFSLSNVYLSHVDEKTRLPQVKEVLQELHREKGNYHLLMGDFNALSPEDNIPASAVDSFSERMKEKYCRDGKLCYDTIEAVLQAGYVDVGRHFYNPEEITGKTDLSGGTGGHTRPIRMDFIFAKPELLPYVQEFTMVKEGLARTASDHFPWYVILDETRFQLPT
mgnify:FL=1